MCILYVVIYFRILNTLCIYACLNCKYLLCTQTWTVILENGHTHRSIWDVCACVHTYHDSITIIIIQNVHCLVVSPRRRETKADRLADCQL